MKKYLPLTLITTLLISCATETKVQSPNSQETSPVTLVSQINQTQETNQPKVFPEDVGWVDVKKDFGAKGDGVTDDTDAILNALASGQNNYTRPKIVYFPSGTYLVRDTLQFPLGGHTCCVSFQGQGKNQTIIKLQDNTPGFERPDQAKALIRTKEGNAAFRNYIRDMTISTGNNNPGAIAIDYVSSNRGGIIDVAIKSEDGQGKTGLAMIRQWPGPSLIKNVEITGFDYGIHTKHPIYGITLEYITLKNQNRVGIFNEGNSLAIRGLASINSVPVIQNNRGLVVVIEGKFAGGDGNTTAINNRDALYVRDIQVEGYQAAIQNGTEIVAGLSQAEYVSDQAYSVFDSPPESLKLPIKDTPNDHDSNLSNWANVQDYGSIQEAMNSGKSTIYFPMGEYKLNEAINVPSTVERIIGFESFINLNQRDLQGSFVVAEDSDRAAPPRDRPLIIEGFLMKNVNIEHQSQRSLAIKYSKIQNQALSNTPNAGDLFLEDVQMLVNLENPQNIWARQLNPETLREAKTKVTNPGGNLWILGLKTEGKGTVLETTNGGKTELLGTLIYPVQEFSPTDEKQAAFINRESEQSLIYKVSASGRKRNYKIQVQETRDGVTKEFLSQDMKRGIMPLFVGHQKH